VAERLRYLLVGCAQAGALRFKRWIVPVGKRPCLLQRLNNAGRWCPDLVPIGKQTLTPAQYSELADVPPELEWLANITNPKTRRAYKTTLRKFMPSPD
jgi:hypothetical protein